MSRCPVCASTRIVVVINPGRTAFCTSCGSQWVQQGSHQRDIRRLNVREGEGIAADGPSR